MFERNREDNRMLIVRNNQVKNNVTSKDFLGKKRNIDFSSSNNVKNLSKVLDLLNKNENATDANSGIVPRKLEFKLSHILHGENTKIEPSNDKNQDQDVYPNEYIDSLLGWKKPAQVGAGLRNLGNTCFLNSVLQSLLYTPAMRNYVSDSNHLNNCKNKGVCFICEYSRLCNFISKFFFKFF